MRLAALSLIAVFVALTGCKGDEPKGDFGSGGMGGGAGGGMGGAGARGGVGGITAASGGAGGESGTAGAMPGGSGGTSASGGTGGAAGVSTDGGNDSGTSGSGGSGGEEMLYENECTIEVQWECKVCDDQQTCSAPTYVVNGDGTVSSSCCGLVWQAATEWVIDPENERDKCSDRDDPAGCYTFDEAQAYCAGLDLPGDGWRVPVAAELQTLMVRDKGTPYIDRVAFPNVSVWDMYWTSSLSDNSPNEAWLGGFGGTFTSRRQQSQKHFVRCVRTE